MFLVFLAHLGRHAADEAKHFAELLGVTEYEARLALATPMPAVVLHAQDRDRASDAAAGLRARGHGAHVFDDADLVPSERMVRMDDFRFDLDGIRRTADGELLGYGDVFAILRAVHDTVRESDRQTPVPRDGAAMIFDRIGTMRRIPIGPTRHEDRESVAYFFRRSGERPWILRERHANYEGLGPERTPVAFANFTRTVVRVANACPTVVSDDRLLRRRVAERASPGAPIRSSREGVDLLAHLLALSIAAVNGSPYR